MKLPSLIDDEECLVRIIKVPSHWDEKKKLLKTAAFKPKVGTSATSVVRQKMGDDFCKQKAMNMPNYVGLAVLRASTVRRLECEVYNKPEDYIGHAEIDFGFSRPLPDTPESVEVLDRLNDLCRSLAKSAQMFKDSCPNVVGWRDGDLCPPGN